MNFFDRLSSFIAFSRPKDQAFLTFFIGLFRIFLLNENREKNPSSSDFFSSFYLTKIEFKIRHLTFKVATKWFALLISRALAFYGILGFESRLFKNNSSFILVNELLFFY